MVWASACEVGCAITECSGLQDDYNSYYNNYYSYHNHNSPVYLLVCVYAGDYPENVDHLFYHQHPYKAGPPCSDCPPLYPLCNPNPYFIHGDSAAASQLELGIATGGIGGLCCKNT